MILNEMNRIQQRAVHLQGLYWPSYPWTDADFQRFNEASDRWDSEHM